MDVTQIPFAKHIGIEKKEEGTLKLEATDMVQNHIQTIHASAQFALAETQSGLFLQEAFPELVGKVAGLLRGATVKYLNPATSSIYAIANLEDGMKEKILSQMERKGRTSAIVHVAVKDVEDVVTMKGDFQWYIHKI
jgi:acyl-coenzyme A thioesterase PaaI-like protein